MSDETTQRISEEAWEDWDSLNAEEQDSQFQDFIIKRYCKIKGIKEE